MLVHKGLYIVVVFIILVTVSIYTIQDHGDEECGVFELHYECDLSGWVTLIYGDLVIGVTLAFVFHYLVSDSNKKIEAAVLKTDQILSEIKRIRDRRETYVIQALKNHFSSLLLCIGMINKFLDSGDEKKRAIVETKLNDLDRILQKGQSVLDLSIDVLDPMIIEKIDKLFTSITDDMSMDLEDSKISDFDQIKVKIKEITAKLDGYEHSAKILK